MAFITEEQRSTIESIRILREEARLASPDPDNFDPQSFDPATALLVANPLGSLPDDINTLCSNLNDDKTAVFNQLDSAVTAGDITQFEADAMSGNITAMLDGTNFALNDPTSGVIGFSNTFAADPGGQIRNVIQSTNLKIALGEDTNLCDELNKAFGALLDAGSNALNAIGGALIDLGKIFAGAIAGAAILIAKAAALIAAAALALLNAIGQGLAALADALADVIDLSFVSDFLNLLSSPCSFKLMNLPPQPKRPMAVPPSEDDDPLKNYSPPANEVKTLERDAVAPDDELDTYFEVQPETSPPETTETEQDTEGEKQTLLEAQTPKIGKTPAPPAPKPIAAPAPAISNIALSFKFDSLINFTEDAYDDLLSKEITAGEFKTLFAQNLESNGIKNIKWNVKATIQSLKIDPVSGQFLKINVNDTWNYSDIPMLKKLGSLRFAARGVTVSGSPPISKPLFVQQVQQQLSASMSTGLLHKAIGKYVFASDMDVIRAIPINSIKGTAPFTLVVPRNKSWQILSFDVIISDFPVGVRIDQNIKLVKPDEVLVYDPFIENFTSTKISTVNLKH